MRLKGSLSAYPVSSKIFVTAGIMLVMMVFSYLFGGLICIWVSGINVFDNAAALNDFKNPQVMLCLKILQLFYSTFTFAISALLCGFLFDDSAKHYLSLKWPKAKLLLPAVLFSVVAIPLINALGEWNTQLHLPASMQSIETWMRNTETQASQLTDALLINPSLAVLVNNLILVAFIPAAGEELMFRGVFQKLITGATKNIHAGVIITAVLFSAFHMQFLGFIPRMIIGVAFGYMLVWSNSLWLPVAAHFVNNAITVLLFYYAQFNTDSETLQNLGSHQNEWPIVLASSLVTVALLVLIYFLSDKKQSSLE